MSRFTFLALLVAGGACNHTTATLSGVIALHDLHQPSTPVNVPTNADDFYRLPWPNDVRMEADGTVDLKRYPRAGMGTLVAAYIDDFDAGIRGFGTNSAIYFRFDGALDATTLPVDPAASLADGATAFVVDVTPTSPTYGQRAPVQAHYVASSYDFIGPYWIALQPFPGIPLRQKTTYAVVLTDGIKGPAGKPTVPDADFVAVLKKGAATNKDAKIAAAAVAYQPFFDWLATQPTLAPHLINATVFTTLDATGLMFKLRKHIYEHVTAPALGDLTYYKENMSGVNQLFESSYMGPIYQVGDPPYKDTGGQIEVDANGDPKLVRMENLRLSLSIPEGDMPAAGWPVVIYAHGTGGDYHSYISDGSGFNAALVTDREGKPIARMAMLGIDQVIAGPRDPTMGNADLNFFNFQNPVGARYNPLQGALDDFQLLRLIKTINVTAAPMTGQPIKFDPDRIYFKGHSEGSLTGQLYLAVEPEVKAAVLSGAGANLILSVLNKTQPVNIPELVQSQFHDPTDQWHPVLNLLQNYLEESDPGNYGRFYFLDPAAGVPPKSIYQSIGLIDHYSPVPNNKAVALSAGLQPINPMLDPIDGLDLVHMTWGTTPVVDNAPGGVATGVAVEYTASGSDGHFVVFDVPAAVKQSNRFLATHAATGKARLDPP